MVCGTPFGDLHFQQLSITKVMSLSSLLKQGAILLILAKEITAYPRADEAAQALSPRQACYQDDILEIFQNYALESYPFCRSLLGIQDITTTLPPVIRRTYVQCPERGQSHD